MTSSCHATYIAILNQKKKQNELKNSAKSVKKSTHNQNIMYTDDSRSQKKNRIKHRNHRQQKKMYQTKIKELTCLKQQ